ncbi:MAG: Type II secretion outermembrane pore forming protein (PulD) [uncultured Sulfurovum sp.]|uniref:Type II secretion outermembrane pore forming protein (PulD) n=1 Tax=uncultured Sulfurovum sp. TaxID=269237 RepID=A0A6S6STW6_9BACT|nr:MAG: Type II secretion outermembrane pore forming protein (PulD) [uncultured Sulfurovum sp.]
MLVLKNNLKKFIAVLLLISLALIPASANRCQTQLFTATLNSELTIGDVVENLADECALSLIVKDSEAKKKMAEKLYFVKMNNASLNEFLDTVLTENDISYVLEDGKLKISYLTTRTFKLHYIAGDRKGTSNAHVTIANSGASSGSAEAGGTQGAGQEGTDSGNGSKTGVSIESTDDFTFWSTIEKEIHGLINRPEDPYTAPLPIVNAEAGMITVTGTTNQLQRVAYYIDDLDQQLKSQVLIDVRILSVTFDDSYTTGVDWNQIYSLQNMAIASASTLQNNISSLTSVSEGELSIGDTTSALGAEPKRSGAIITRGSATMNDVVKFLKTQGDVKSISNPKILTLNNQPALISVGNELFYKIQSTSLLQGGSGLGTQQTGETIDSVFAGILLDITPEISEDGSITLKINPSISDTIDTVSTSTTGSRTIPPDLSRKQISSVVTLQDGEHVILGGLISSKSGTKISKVPLLGDLPLLDNLFKREVKVDTVDELVLIITPHIIKKDKDLSLEDLGYKKLNDEQ